MGERILEDLLSGYLRAVHLVGAVLISESAIGVDEPHHVALSVDVFSLESVIWLYPCDALDWDASYNLIQVHYLTAGYHIYRIYI